MSRDGVSVRDDGFEDVADAGLEALGLPVDERVVAVVFDLHLVGLVLVAGVLEVLDGDVEVELVADVGDGVRNLDDADGAGDLVVDGVGGRPVVGVGRGELSEALDGILERDERFALFALAVNRDRVAGGGLCAEPVADGPEVIVEVEPRLQAVVSAGLLGFGPVDDGRPDVRNRDVELPVSQPHVRGVVALTEVIPATCHCRKRHLVALALTLHRGATLGDRELGGAVDARRRRLDEVGVREAVLSEAEQQVAGRLEIVVLGVIGAFTVDLGVRRRWLSGRVNDCVRLVNLQQLLDKGLLREVSFDEGEIAEAMNLAGGFETLVYRGDRRRGDRADLLDPLSAGEVVHEDDAVVGSVGDAKGSWPADIAVGASEEDGHGYSEFQ